MLTDAELKTSSALMIVLQELYTQKLLDRIKLAKKMKSLSKEIEDYLDTAK